MLIPSGAPHLFARRSFVPRYWSGADHERWATGPRWSRSTTRPRRCRLARWARTTGLPRRGGRASRPHRAVRGLVDPAGLVDALGSWRPDAGAPDGPLVELPVRYDGPDLAAVARSWGMTTAEAAATVHGARYVVAFCGFAPGFAYLAGLPEELAVPRLATPRTRVPAGSVAAGRHLVRRLPDGVAGRLAAARPDRRDAVGPARRASRPCSLRDPGAVRGDPMSLVVRARTRPGDDPGPRPGRVRPPRGAPRRRVGRAGGRAGQPAGRRTPPTQCGPRGHRWPAWRCATDRGADVRGHRCRVRGAGGGRRRRLRRAGDRAGRRRGVPRAGRAPACARIVAVAGGIDVRAGAGVAVDRHPGLRRSAGRRRRAPCCRSASRRWPPRRWTSPDACRAGGRCGCTGARGRTGSSRTR